MTKNKDIRWYLEGSLDFKNSVIVPIDASPFLVGRDACCNLKVTSNNISRRHAEIIMRRGHLYLKDLKSKNGTRINNNTLDALAEVQHGDVLSFGKVEFRVNQGLVKEEVDSETRILAQESMTGNGRFVEFSQEMEFLHLLKQADITTYFQPIVTLKGNKTVAYEVLGRGVRTGLPHAPDKLLEIGKKLRKEIELSELFRIKGVQVGAALAESKILFLNTHPQEKLDKGLEQSLRRIRMIVPNRPLALEIHESHTTDVATMKTLSALMDELDIQLVYDDFGIGQARLNEIAEVPPDYLKFDISMIQGIHKASANKQGMVKRLVDMSNDMGIFSIAEGVEAVAEVKVCRQMGFTHAQGYYFGRPAPISMYRPN
jgi:EAL domain-containing protein (putative c-di-GMP-specific phosphodiesterase class I)